MYNKNAPGYLPEYAQNISGRTFPTWPLCLLLGKGTGGLEHGMGGSFIFQCILSDSLLIWGHVNVSPIQINKCNSKFKKSWAQELTLCFWACVFVYMSIFTFLRMYMCACMYISNLLCSQLWVSLPKWNIVPEAFPCSTIFDGSLLSIRSKYLVLGLGIFCHLIPAYLLPYLSHSLCHRKMELLALSMPTC